MQKRLLPHRERTAGFSLIELMVTVAIVAILAAIGYPSYKNYVMRGQITSATNGLAALRANMERYFQDNRTYASTGAFTTPCAAAASAVNFTFSCVGTPTTTTFKAQALGTGPMAGFTYFVDQSDVESTTVTGVSGWNSCTTAWVTKQGPAAAGC